MFVASKELRRACIAPLAVTCALAARAQGPIELVDYDVSGNVSAGWAYEASISADGRFVAYTSGDGTLVAGDTNGATDVFVRDRLLGITLRASVSATGAQANDQSWHPSLAANGRHVVFVSPADNLVPGDVNGTADVFVRDLALQTTVLASVSYLGGPADDTHYDPQLSADGRFVVFSSIATNLVASDTNGAEDVFLRDLVLGTNERISRRQNGGELVNPSLQPAIDASGRFVAFTTSGRILPTDQNDLQDVYVLDRQTGVFKIASLGHGGQQPTDGSSWPSLSANGNLVAFWSGANNLLPGFHVYYNPDVYVRDLTTGAIEIVSVNSAGQHSNSASLYPRISGDGRVVAFESFATNLAPGIYAPQITPHIYAHDRASRSTVLIDVAHDGTPPTDEARTPAPSFDGRFVAFMSRTDGLVPADQNAASNIYVRERAPSTPLSYCTSKTNSAGCAASIGFSGSPSATSATVFDVHATNVVSSEAGMLICAFTPMRKPFQGGRLCVAAPVARTPIQFSGGSPPPGDCSGQLHFDFNARIQSGLYSGLVAGSVVYAQYWYRDGADPTGHGTGLSDALMFTIGN